MTISPTASLLTSEMGLINQVQSLQDEVSVEDSLCHNLIVRMFKTTSFQHEYGTADKDHHL